MVLWQTRKMVPTSNEVKYLFLARFEYATVIDSYVQMLSFGGLKTEIQNRIVAFRSLSPIYDNSLHRSKILFYVYLVLYFKLLCYVCFRNRYEIFV